MLISQEIWYMVKGTYNYRKNITVIYRYTRERGRETVGFLEQGYALDTFLLNVTVEELHTAVTLPSLEVTPSQFKTVMLKRKGIFGK